MKWNICYSDAEYESAYTNGEDLGQVEAEMQQYIEAEESDTPEEETEEQQEQQEQPDEPKRDHTDI